MPGPITPPKNNRVLKLAAGVGGGSEASPAGSDRSFLASSTNRNNLARRPIREIVNREGPTTRSSFRRSGSYQNYQTRKQDNDITDDDSDGQVTDDNEDEVDNGKINLEDISTVPVLRRENGGRNSGNFAASNVASPANSNYQTSSPCDVTSGGVGGANGTSQDQPLRKTVSSRAKATKVPSFAVAPGAAMGGLDSQGEDEDEVTEPTTTNSSSGRRGRRTSGGGDQELHHSYTSIKQRTLSPGGTTTPKSSRPRFNDSSSSRSGGSSYYHEDANTPAHYLTGRRYFIKDKDANDTEVHRSRGRFNAADKSSKSNKKSIGNYEQLDSRASTNGRYFVAFILAILVSTGAYFANGNSKIALRNAATFQQSRPVAGNEARQMVVKAVNELKAVFPAQKEETWRSIKANLVSINKAESEQAACQVVIGDSPLTDCFAKAVAGIASQIRNKRLGKSLDGSLTLDEVKASLDKSDAAVILNIDKVKGTEAMALHSVCDSKSGPADFPYVHTAVVSTINGQRRPEPEKSVSVQAEDFAGRLLTASWTKTVSEDKISALISRVVLSAFYFEPEESNAKTTEFCSKL